MSDFLQSKIIQFAKEAGFDLVGFSPVETLEIESNRLERWLEDGKHAGMHYMERNIEKRRDVRELLPDAQSVISLGLNYYSDRQHESQNGYGKISRYAWGKDYHLIIWDKLTEIIERIKEIDPAFAAISYVDTGPVMDKVWAVKGGLGWMGKHTNVINPEIGSWFFIANIICNHSFDESFTITDHCGTCTACIDACPTNALTPYNLDARRCISYLTIENKGEISPEFSGRMEYWLFGCDICQDVCPWNKRFSSATNVVEFISAKSTTSLNLDVVLDMSQEEFKSKFAESPILRTKLSGLQRNARFLKNQDEKESI